LVKRVGDLSPDDKSGEDSTPNDQNSDSDPMSFVFNLFLSGLFSQYFRRLSPVVRKYEYGCSLEQHRINIDDNQNRFNDDLLAHLGHNLVDLQRKLDCSNDRHDGEEESDEALRLAVGLDQPDAAENGSQPVQAQLNRVQDQHNICFHLT